MPHFYERNIIEIKNEYQTFLIKILTPLIYEGILSIYIDSKKYHKELKKKKLNDPNVDVTSTLKLFQLFLKNTPTWNHHIISEETNRIKEKCKCSEWFDDLLKAVIKSNIILLTFNVSNKESDLINHKLHETIQSHDFIHKCYIEVAREIYNFPELFYDKFKPIEIKRNQRETFNIIKESISEAIRKLLPMKLILNEFLKNDYTKINQKIGDEIPDSVYKNIKSLLKKDLRNYNNSYYSRTDSYSNYTSSSDSSTNTNKSSDFEYIKDKLSNLMKNKDISNKIEEINKEEIKYNSNNFKEDINNKQDKTNYKDENNKKNEINNFVKINKFENADKTEKIDKTDKKDKTEKIDKIDKKENIEKARNLSNSNSNNNKKFNNLIFKKSKNNFKNELKNELEKYIDRVKPKENKIKESEKSIFFKNYLN